MVKVGDKVDWERGEEHGWGESPYTVMQVGSSGNVQLNGVGDTDPLGTWWAEASDLKPRKEPIEPQGVLQYKAEPELSGLEKAQRHITASISFEAIEKEAYDAERSLLAHYLDDEFPLAVDVNGQLYVIQKDGSFEKATVAR